MDYSTFSVEGDDGAALVVHRWVPPTEVSGVVQVVHGMQEHGFRYAELAAALGAAGYATSAMDLRGHGLTLGADGQPGVLGPGGWEQLVEDNDRLATRLADEHAGAPLFLLGHSFGSFLAQAYVQRHGARLTGAILCGTNGRNLLVGLGTLLARRTVRKEGAATTATTLERLAIGGYNKRFEPGATGREWLSRDPDAVRRYAEDPLCGAPFPNGFYLELTRLLGAIWRRENEARIPRDLPVLVIAGTEDPVGDRTRGVEALLKRYRKLGIADLSHRFYEGYRHELFHERGRELVFEDLIAWLGARRGRS